MCIIYWDLTTRMHIATDGNVNLYFLISHLSYMTFDIRVKS